MHRMIQHRTCFFLFSIMLGAFFVPVLLHAQPELSGAQSGLLPPGDYTVVDDIWVAANTNWQLSSGSNLRFNPETDLLVNGRLTAIGQPTDSIAFLPEDPSLGWNGIVFDDVTGLSRMEHCIVSGSVSTGISVLSYGTLRLRNSRISNNSNYLTGIGGMFMNSPVIDTLYAVEFSNNEGTGFAYEHGILSVINCVFANNDGTGLEVSTANGLTIRGSSFIQNQMSGAMLYFVGLDAFIDSCSFYDNAGTEGAGINYVGTGLFITRSMFYMNNSINDGGAMCSQRSGFSNIIISHCAFLNNTAGGSGGAINLEGYVLANSIVAGNQGADAAVSISRNWFNCPNNLFYDNTPLDLLAEPGQFYDEFGEIVDENLNGDPCDIYQNLFLDPELQLDSPFLYELAPSSPCINGGHPDSTYDADISVCDIGVFYYDLTNSVFSQPKTEEGLAAFFIYPNPTNGVIRVMGRTTERIQSLAIFNILGRELYRKENVAFPIVISGNEFPAPTGVYYIRLTTATSTEITKFTMIK